VPEPQAAVGKAARRAILNAALVQPDGVRRPGIRPGGVCHKGIKVSVAVQVAEIDIPTAWAGETSFAVGALYLRGQQGGGRTGSPAAGSSILFGSNPGLRLFRVGLVGDLELCYDTCCQCGDSVASY
jgi:hypothetical protein